MDVLGTQNTEESPSSLNWVSCVSRTKFKGDTCVIQNWSFKNPVKGLRKQNGAQVLDWTLLNWWHYLAEPIISGCQGAGVPSAFSTLPDTRTGNSAAGSVLFRETLPWEGMWTWRLLEKISLYQIICPSWPFRSGAFLSCSDTRTSTGARQVRHPGYRI